MSGRIYGEEDVKMLLDECVARAIEATLEAREGFPVPCQCVVDPEVLKEALKFYQNVNRFFEGSGKTIWNTILVSIVLSILGLITLGLWNKSGQ